MADAMAELASLSGKAHGARGNPKQTSAPKTSGDTREILLVVDDDPGIQRSIKWALDDFRVVTAGDRAAAVEALHTHRPKVVALDLGLPPDTDDASEGFRTMRDILCHAPRTKVIVVSGTEDHDNAVRAIAEGAYDFYAKPVDPDVLGLIVARALHVRRLEDENARLQVGTARQLPEIITSDAGMEKLCRTVEKVAATDIGVLITGESGTGKELFARGLHTLSERAEGPFIAINCAAIPEHLLESELFGHEKGAFSGAYRQVKGKIEQAHGGTLFLDEIGDMPTHLQSKLLRFLQERVIERVGGRTSIPVDLRVVCATHRDIDEMIQGGDFREDLYYRLSEIRLHVPPLRERPGDAVLIAGELLLESTQRLGVRKTLSPEASAAIEGHAWPGNVRELVNRVKRATVLSEGAMVTAADLDLGEPAADDPRALAAAEGDGEAAPEPGPISLRAARDAADRRVIRAALKRHNGNITQTAQELQISRPTLYNLMREHGLEP